MYGAGSRIGTERESALHSALKTRYAGPEGRTEVGIGDFVCDALTAEGEYVEIQTGSLGPLKDKAALLALSAPLRIVHPIIAKRCIETYGPGGELLRRRASPRKGSPWDLFAALIHAPLLPATPNLTVELAVVEVLEKRMLDGKGSWRRRGARITGKELTAYRETIVLKGLEDYRRFIPFSREDAFTVKDLAERTDGPSKALARKALYVLHKLGLVERTGKRGNAWLYLIKN